MITMIEALPPFVYVCTVDPPSSYPNDYFGEGLKPTISLPKTSMALILLCVQYLLMGMLKAFNIS